ncbi:MAG TPA: ABC transporter substrate-binding protein [Candidatus Nitrosotenuis sp.]|jgi:putative ABC transport system substrate-binding protein|nr:ABC transporter substrate-binding protein [Candidatus Nitrosotenuis sp.]
MIIKNSALRNFFSFSTVICHLITFAFLTTFINSATLATNNPPLIGISQIVEHPALEAVHAGLMDALKSSDLIEGKDYYIQFKNAQGNMATNVQIAQQLVGLNPKIIIAISTPSAQALAAATRSTKTPLVFAAVTDPIAAKLIKDLKKPEGNITGVSDHPPIPQQIMLIKTLLPKAQRIGILFNPAEVNSTHLVEAFKKQAENAGFKIIIKAAMKTTEVMIAARELIGNVDVIYIPQDNTIVSAIDGLIQLQWDHHLPLVTSDEALVQKGALTAVGTSYFKSGQQLGHMVIRILKGDTISNIPVAFPENPEFYIHRQTAKKLAIPIPDDLSSKAQLYG